MVDPFVVRLVALPVRRRVQLLCAGRPVSTKAMRYRGGGANASVTRTGLPATERLDRAGLPVQLSSPAKEMTSVPLLDRKAIELRLLSYETVAWEPTVWNVTFAHQEYPAGSARATRVTLYSTSVKAIEMWSGAPSTTSCPWVGEAE